MSEDRDGGARAAGERAGKWGNLRRRGWAFGTAGASVALTLLLLVAPTAGASGVHPRTTHTAPYSGTLDLVGSASVAGCSAAALGTSPSFNLTTGVAKGSVSSSASNCPALNGNQGVASEQFGLASPTFTATKGVHKVSAKWTVKWSISIKSTSPSGTGTTQAIGTVALDLIVFDTTAGAVVNLTSWFRQSIGFGNSSVTAPGTATKTLTMNVTLVKGDVYYIATYAFLFAYSLVNASPGGTAMASADLATGKDKGTLLSYTFT